MSDEIHRELDYEEFPSKPCGREFNLTCLPLRVVCECSWLSRRQKNG